MKKREIIKCVEIKTGVAVIENVKLANRLLMVVSIAVADLKRL
jgi:hypothetical protein